MLPKVKLVTAVSEWNVDNVVKTVVETAATGNIGDGKIFVSAIEDAIRVRTGEKGKDAI